MPRSASRWSRNDPDEQRIDVLRAQRPQGAVPVRPWARGEEEPERVAVGGHGVRAGTTLADEPLGEECLERRGERAHGSTP